MSLPADFARDYLVVTREDRSTRTWTWEIQRQSKPLGVRLYHGGFPSQSAEKLAGEKALKALIDDLVKEADR